jgi:hypothetical protein
MKTKKKATDLDKPGYLAIKWGYWGKAHTIAEAKTNAAIGRGDEFIVYEVPFALKDIGVNDCGDVCWPMGQKATLIEHGNKPKR